MSGEGIDVEFALAAFAVCILLVLWAVFSYVVQRQGRSERAIRRHANRVIRERDLAQFRPVVVVTPDEGHAVIHWREDEADRAILLTWHHVLDAPRDTQRSEAESSADLP